MLSGNSVPKLAAKVAAHLGVPLMAVNCGRAPDGASERCFCRVAACVVAFALPRTHNHPVCTCMHAHARSPVAPALIPKA
jgi:hypothetical protein